jgi:hypothetical protein
VAWTGDTAFYWRFSLYILCFFFCIGKHLGFMHDERKEGKRERRKEEGRKTEGRRKGGQKKGAKSASKERKSARLSDYSIA